LSANDIALLGSAEVVEGPDPLLRMFNPRCAHDRASYDVMHCVECKAWTDAHWADPMPLGTLSEREKE
jgi:hypothetical protein